MSKSIYRMAALSGLTMFAAQPLSAAQQSVKPDASIPFGSPLGEAQPLPPGTVMDQDTEQHAPLMHVPPIVVVAKNESARIADCFALSAKLAAGSDKGVYSLLAKFFTADQIPLQKIEDSEAIMFRHGDTSFMVGANFSRQHGYVIKVSNATNDPEELPMSRSQSATILRCVSRPMLS